MAVESAVAVVVTVVEKVVLKRCPVSIGTLSSNKGRRKVFTEGSGIISVTLDIAQTGQLQCMS